MNGLIPPVLAFGGSLALLLVILLLLISSLLLSLPLQLLLEEIGSIVLDYISFLFQLLDLSCPLLREDLLMEFFGFFTSLLLLLRHLRSGVLQTSVMTRGGPLPPPTPGHHRLYYIYICAFAINRQSDRGTLWLRSDVS